MTKMPDKKLKKVAFLGYKGGVGKTSLCLGVADSLHRRDEKSLIIDWDKQRNLTKIIKDASKTPHGITTLLTTGSVDSFTVNEHIELIVGSADANESKYDRIPHDTLSLRLRNVDCHVLIDLNATIDYSIIQSKVFCDTFVILLTGNTTAFDGAMELAGDIVEWNKRDPDRPEAHIRFCFVHNCYNKGKDARVIDDAIAALYPDVALFRVSNRRIVDHATNEKCFVSQIKGESQGLILGEYDEITSWILEG